MNATMEGKLLEARRHAFVHMTAEDLRVGQPIKSLPDGIEREEIENHVNEDAPKWGTWLKEETELLREFAPASLISPKGGWAGVALQMNIKARATGCRARKFDAFNVRKRVRQLRRTKPQGLVWSREEKELLEKCMRKYNKNKHGYRLVALDMGAIAAAEGTAVRKFSADTVRTQFQKLTAVRKGSPGQSATKDDGKIDS